MIEPLLLMLMNITTPALAIPLLVQRKEVRQARLIFGQESVESITRWAEQDSVPYNTSHMVDSDCVFKGFIKYNKDRIVLCTADTFIRVGYFKFGYYNSDSEEVLP